MELLREYKKIEIFLANSKTFKSDGVVFCIQPKSMKKDLWSCTDKVLSESISIATQLAQYVVNDKSFIERWANLIIRKNGIFIYGRRVSSLYWGKPITSIKSVLTFKQNGIIHITKLISTIPFGAIPASKPKIFKLSSLAQSKAESIFWDERPPEKKKFVLFTTKKFISTLPIHPHLNGLHIQIFPRNAYWDSISTFIAPWQVKKINTATNNILKGDTEIAFLAIKIIQLLKGKFRDIEYHMSGNWDNSLQDIKRASTKRKIKMSSNLGGTGHGHIYAVKRGKINLPSRPQKEKPNEWKKIKQTSEKQAKVFQRIIISKMK